MKDNNPITKRDVMDSLHRDLVLYREIHPMNRAMSYNPGSKTYRVLRGDAIEYTRNEHQAIAWYNNGFSQKGAEMKVSVTHEPVGYFDLLGNGAQLIRETTESYVDGMMKTEHKYIILSHHPTEGPVEFEELGPAIHAFRSLISEMAED